MKTLFLFLSAIIAILLSSCKSELRDPKEIVLAPSELGADWKFGKFKGFNALLVNYVGSEDDNHKYGGDSLPHIYTAGYVSKEGKEIGLKVQVFSSAEKATKEHLEMYNWGNKMPELKEVQACNFGDLQYNYCYKNVAFTLYAFENGSEKDLKDFLTKHIASLK